MGDRDRWGEQLARGTWYIVRSSLPMWRESAGAISYSPLPDGSVGDVVTSRKQDKIDHVVGIDRPIAIDGWQWEWRGVQPLTFFVRSRWSFVARDGDGDAAWAVTMFEKTIFSAAGIDIYCRKPVIDVEDAAAAVQACAAHPVASTFLPSLFEPPCWKP